MSVINDMAEKAAHWKPLPPITICAEDHVAVNPAGNSYTCEIAVQVKAGDET